MPPRGMLALALLPKPEPCDDVLNPEPDGAVKDESGEGVAVGVLVGVGGGVSVACVGGRAHKDDERAENTARYRAKREGLFIV